MTPQDLHFAATEHCHIDIIPAVKMERLQMIKAEYGPFRPQIRCRVPLWLALTMRASGQCRILAPDWLTVENLTNVLACERERAEEFAGGLEPRYLEIFVALQRACPEDLQPELPDLQRLVQCIREVRQQKIIYGLSSLDGTALFLRNAGTMEINQAKAVLLPVMDQLVRLKRAVWEEDKAASLYTSSRPQFSTGKTMTPSSSQSLSG